VKEELIDVFCVVREKQASQFFGKCEGDHEVRGTDAFAEFSFDPLHGGVLAALGT
jgi:hypothetical protein